MQLRQATTFIASTAFFLPNVNASLLRGVNGEFEIGDNLEITEDRPGTFLRALVDYEDPSHDGPDETFNIMVDDSIYEIDDVDEELKRFKSGEAVTIPKGVTLGTKSGKAKTNGAKIKPSKEGKKDKKKTKNLFGRNLEGRTEEQQRNVDQLRRHLSSSTLGDKSVVAVRVQTTDAVYSNSEAVLRREVFGIGEGGDIFNLASGYDQCSYGSLTFSPLASQSGSGGVSIENGVVTISVDVAAEGNTDANVRNAVTNKIRATFGDNMQSVADYWMYCLPPGTDGGWIAYAYINSYISVYNNNWCNYPSGQMHELGHNLGFAHSGEGTAQYDDRSGMMGYSYSNDEGPVMCFNAAKSWQTGWYGPDGAHGDKTLEYSLGDGCLVKTLSGIADYDTTSNLVLVKVVNPNGSGADIFVAFNAKKDINSGTLEAGNQVTVVQVEDGGGLVYSKSTLLDKLSSGATYTNSNFGGDSLTVEVVNISGSDSAEVKIYFGSSCTVTPPPSPTNPPTPMPTKVGQSGPQSASYDSGLGAPKCSFGSSCDSGGLLNGRGTINGGNEPNQPNTLNSCTDGGSGSYHSDESIDKIVVTQTSGSANDFTEGDDVTISATVWCWSSADYIDFYYASDASSPVWNQIGNRQQCPSAGEHILSASYTLPTGSIQAVRANLMYNSNTASAASCTSGSYDDTDDLVITVKPNQPAPPTSPPTPPPTGNPTPNPTAQPSNPPTPAPSNPPTAQPTPIPTSPPTPQPSNSPTTAPPTKTPTPLPTPVPTNPPTAPPTSNPTQNPTPAPSNPPTSAPSNPPTVQPTPIPTSPPTPLPTPVPTNPPTAPPTANPTQNPTPQPSNPPTPAPSNPPTTPPPTSPPVVTPPPTPAPSNPPTSPPTQQPTDVPTNPPTALPTAPPTASPTSTPDMTKSLVCGRGDVPDKPCAEGLKGTAPIDELHEVRCCRDCTGIDCGKPWKRKCSTFDSDLYARSKVGGECKVGTFAEALDFCRKSTNDDSARLCTPLEVENSCTKGTGCQFDQEQVWACAYDGHTCQADSECCGTCVNGTCQGEFTLFP
jgi:hypothetical protein